MEYDDQEIPEEVIASAPPPMADISEEPAVNNSKQTEEEIPAETIDFSKENITNNLKPQENKFWRFTFKSSENTNSFKNAIEKIPELSLTVNFEIKQNTPDVTIKQGENEVGKINLFLCDRRDANLPEKYYCKVYFYHFKDQKIYQAVKTAVINFFDNFKSNNKTNNNTSMKTGGRRKMIRTYKKKHIIRRKKTSKRKQRR